MSKTASSNRIGQYEADLAHLVALGKALEGIEQRMADCRIGTPGSGFGGSGSGSGGGSPVERALLGAGCTCDKDACTCRPEMAVDQGSAALARLDRLLAMTRKAADEAYVILGEWSQREPDAKAKRIADEQNTAVPECQYTRKVAGRFVAALCTSDCDGVLDAPIPVSRWVYDFTRRNRRLPTKTQLERNLDGVRVMIRA